MNADNFRHLYEYHFTANRKIWDNCIMPLPQELFIQKIDYSVGSIRNQAVHLMNIDDRWFSGLRGVKVPGFTNPVYYHRREKIRTEWDAIETNMRDYLYILTDDLLQKDFEPGIPIWAVLFHVLNHGTDHRAQMLAMLNQLGAHTFPQDYFFFASGKM